MRCEDKKRYPDKQTAAVAAAWVRKYKAASGPAFDPFHETLAAYICPQCAFWHIGHDKHRMHELGPIANPGVALKKAIKKAAKKAARKARKIEKAQSRAAKPKATKSMSSYQLLIKRRILVWS